MYTIIKQICIKSDMKVILLTFTTVKEVTVATKSLPHMGYLSLTRDLNTCKNHGKVSNESDMKVILLNFTAKNKSNKCHLGVCPCCGYLSLSKALPTSISSHKKCIKSGMTIILLRFMIGVTKALCLQYKFFP